MLFGLHSPIFGPLHPIVGSIEAAMIPDLSGTYLTLATAASTYLKLDCSNDPLTDTLQVNSKVQLNGTTEYISQETW